MLTGSGVPIVLFLVAATAVLVVPAAAAPPPAVAADAAASVPAPGVVLDQVAASRGGIDLLDRLTEVRRAGALTVMAAGGEEEMTVRMTVHSPDRARLETGQGGTTRVRVLDQERAYQTVGDGAPVDLDGPGRESLRRLVLQDEGFLVSHARRGLLQVKGSEPAGDGQLPAGHEASGGTAVIIGTPVGEDIRLVVPTAGGLPLRVDYQLSDGRGGMRPASEVYRSWRVIDGIPFPFEVVLYLEGRLATLLRYDSIELTIESAPAGE